ncbi:hypothetical protein JL722_13141 [Aureococcus anophagefferens]|nr:hypothetical protein JL722_13141 [Aureococcus anophagefferens]
MKVRQHTLPVLQNLLKRDPPAYKEEFEAIWRQYLSELEVFKLRSAEGEAAPGRLAKDGDEKRLAELATFVSHTCKHYDFAAQRFGPQLCRLLKDRCVGLAPELRLSLVQACVLAVKGLLDPVELLELCFELIRRVRDRALRDELRTHVVNDVRRCARGGGESKGSQQALMKKFQRCLFFHCGDASREGSDKSAKVALDAVVDLYGRGVWTCAPTVNCVGARVGDEQARVHGHPLLPGHRAVARARRVGFRRRGRARRGQGVRRDKKGPARRRRPQALEEGGSERDTKKQLKRVKKLARDATDRTRGDSKPVFPAIALLDDPHKLCERLLARLRAQKDKFEIRVAMMDLISRVACAHKLALLPFYSYVQRYLTAHQKDAPKLLAVFAQACHDLVPPDELVAAARKIADAFVSERNAPEAMALGINALREVAGRCPALLDEPEMLGFVRDLAAHAKHRDRSVVVAARGWINVVREHYPALLHKKDRGRAHAASTREPAKYGAATAATAVEGEELLRAYERGDLPEDFDDAVRECDGVGEGVKDDDGAGWVDVDDDDGGAEEDGAEVVEDEDDEEEEAGEDDDEEEAGEDDEDDGEEDEEEASDDGGGGEDGDEGWQDASDDGEAAAPAAKKARAAELRAAGGRAGASGQGFLQSNDILPDAVKRKTSVEERKAQNVLDREQYQLKTHAGGKTNTEKRRTKNYLMVQKKKARTNGLKKRTRGAPKEQLKRDKRKRRRL